MHRVDMIHLVRLSFHIKIDLFIYYLFSKDPEPEEPDAFEKSLVAHQ